MNKRRRVKTRRGLGARLVRGFFVIIFSLFALGLLVLAGASFLLDDSSDGFMGFSPAGILGSIFDDVPERLNILLIGTDFVTAGIGRADFLMLASIQSSGAIDLISIPRDSFVTMPQYRLDILREHGRHTAPASGQMRINEVTHHAGPALGPNFIRLAAEELVGISIDYYVQLDVAGLARVIDVIGGVYFDVPRRMLYHDPYQDLLIDLQPGYQLLNGYAAANLVRYRQSFATGDFGRMAVQQDFMMAAAAQILDMDNILSSPMGYISVFINYVDTDLGLLGIGRYLPLLSLIDMGLVSGHMLYGHWGTVGQRYYHLVDQDHLSNIMDKILNTGNNMAERVHVIQVLNGTGIHGLAAQTADRLAAMGYYIDSIGNHELVNHTQIILQSPGLEHNFDNHFQDFMISFDSNIQTDAIIILGSE